MSDDRCDGERLMKDRKDTDLARAVEWSIWNTPGIGPSTMALLASEVSGDFAGWLQMGRLDRLAAIEATGVQSRAHDDLMALDRAEATRGLEVELESLPPQSRIIHRNDDRYPDAFQELEEPPRFLYIRGSADSLHRSRLLSVVGSRRARVTAVRQTRQLASQVAREGPVIVSGGALGVDVAAHRGAVDADGQTVVVLPGGIDKPSPARNRRVFRRVLERGCLISEYPLGAQVRKYHFHRRNQLIAALGHVTLVVRAGVESGTMITARWSAKLGRPIFTIPGGVNDPHFAGCNLLLTKGAGCVRHARDLLDGWTRSEHSQLYRVPVSALESDRIDNGRTSKRSTPKASTGAGTRFERQRALPEDLSDAARQLIKLLGDIASEHDDPYVHIDSLAAEWDREGATVESSLLELELYGLIAKKPGKRAYGLA